MIVSEQNAGGFRCKSISDDLLQREADICVVPLLFGEVHTVTGTVDVSDPQRLPTSIRKGRPIAKKAVRGRNAVDFGSAESPPTHGAITKRAAPLFSNNRYGIGLRFSNFSIAASEIVGSKSPVQPLWTHPRER